MAFFFFFLNFQKAVHQLTNFDIVLLNISKYQTENNEQKATELIILRGKRRNIAVFILVHFSHYEFF